MFDANLFVLCAVWAVFKQPKQFAIDASLEAICGKLSDVSRTRQASGFLGNFKGSSGASLGFFTHIRGHLQAFSATIITTCRQFMHLSKNMFRQCKIRELSGISVANRHSLHSL